VFDWKVVPVSANIPKLANTPPSELLLKTLEVSVHLLEVTLIPLAVLLVNSQLDVEISVVEEDSLKFKM